MNSISRYVTYSMLAVLVVVCCGPAVAAEPWSDRKVVLTDAGRPASESQRPSLASFSVGIEQAPGQADPTSVTPVEFEVLFGKAIDPLTFTPSDILQVGSATVGSWGIVDSGDQTLFYLSATAITDGTVVPTLPAGEVEDDDGNSNHASISLDNSVTFGTFACNTLTYLYVAIWSPAKIRVYCVENDGSLTFESEVDAPGDARDMQIAADGTSLFYAHRDLTRFTLSTDGSLVQAQTREVGNGSFDDLVLDPAGVYLYGTHSRNGGRVYVYDASKASMPEVQIQTGLYLPHGVTIDPLGQYLYVANGLPEEVYSYPVQGNGTLDGSQRQISDYTARPMYFAMHPTLDRLYWTETVGGSLLAGFLSGGQVSDWDLEFSGWGARPITMDEDGSFIYVANNNNDDISVTGIAASGGLIGGGLTPTARRPEHLHLHPNGDYLYVASAGDAGGPSKISVYDVEADGSLTPHSSVTIADQGAYRLAIVNLTSP